MSDASENIDELFKELKEFLLRIPGITSSIGAGIKEDKNWWIKFSIDIEHPLAWNVVQELGHVVNYISIDEKLPTVFYPVSPPPYMNGGPLDFLSWIIESTNRDFKPKILADWLEGRLPKPVEDVNEWNPDIE